MKHHLSHCRWFFQDLRYTNFTTGEPKYELMRIKTKFQGSMVVNLGMKIGKDYKKLIIICLGPGTLTKCCSFLELVHISRQFTQKVTKIAAPSRNLTRKRSNVAIWNLDIISSPNLALVGIKHNFKTSSDSPRSKN